MGCDGSTPTMAARDEAEEQGDGDRKGVEKRKKNNRLLESVECYLHKEDWSLGLWGKLPEW